MFKNTYICICVKKNKPSDQANHVEDEREDDEDEDAHAHDLTEEGDGEGEEEDHEDRPLAEGLEHGHPLGQPHVKADLLGVNKVRSISPANKTDSRTFF